MLGVLLMGISQFFAEIGMSMGKYEVSKKRESLVAMGFLNAFWATVFLIIFSLFSGNFTFSLESLPLFSVRVVLEIVLMFISLDAVLTADRSTFAFLRTLTIPLLLGIDLFLGYAISPSQMAGVSLMVVAFVILTLNHGLSKKGKMLSLLSALIPIGTITIYKYNITHYNSVEAEQTIVHAIQLLVFLGVGYFYSKENLIAYLFKKRFLSQSLAAGAATVFMSFAYVFAPASIVMSAKRAFEVLGAIASGKTYFKEKHILVKLISLALIVCGVLLILIA